MAVIKGRGESPDGEQILFLGLTAENMRRLQQDMPIRITADQMAELGLPRMDVVIIGGDTEASISAQLGGLPLQPEVQGQRFIQRPHGS